MKPVSDQYRLTLAMEISGYALHALAEDDELVLYRGRRSGDSNSILVRAPVTASPRSTVLNRLDREYSFASELQSEWAVRPLALVRHDGRTMLMLEDPGGLPLRQALGKPFEFGRFLRLAINLATALGRAHRHGIIHKDVKPENLLVDTADHTRLMGFGIASRLARERQAFAPPEVIDGTLPYMAPEQTGRMNRSIDTRSDLYSLGVTLYEMLVGELPFAAADALEWIHCHVARQPIPSRERLTYVPPTVDAIIMKLLAKSPEERYQTAAGVVADLRRCLAGWEAHGRIDPFPIGTEDASEQLMVPERLYGRAREVGALLDAFERVASHGTVELVLVSGHSGIGKSAVVSELHKALMPRGVLFGSGKFDQYDRGMPYATLVQAFQDLVRQILGRSRSEIDRWRLALQDAVGANGELMVNLIPELELIVGRQPPLVEVAPHDAESRFQMTLQRLLAAFARPEHPLVLFLDDLQWPDPATLNLLRSCLVGSDVKHLLVCGAYRSDEVGPSHPLTHTLAALRNAGARTQVIALSPLTLDSIKELVADTLRSEPERVRAFAEFVHQRSGGNPFFAIQLITALAETGHLAFDRAATAWTWDLPAMREAPSAGNVVDLLAAKLGRLPAATREALKYLACLGNFADATTASLVLREFGLADASLAEAVRAGLILGLGGAFAFVHDRVREAAYALVSDDERAATHLRIGRALESLGPQNLDERIFAIVDQLNRGAALLTAAADRVHVAELNLAAGRRAKMAAAYDSALAYLGAGQALLDDEAWRQQYALAFALEFEGADCDIRRADFFQAEARLSALKDRARNLPDRAAVTRLMAALYIILNRNERTAEVCLECLRGVGINWSLHPTDADVWQEHLRIQRVMGGRAIEALAGLPAMADLDCRATMDVLTSIAPPGILSDNNLQRLVVGRMVNLTLERGNSDASCVGYVLWGMILCSHFGEYDAGFRFGRLGLELVDRPGLDRFKGRVYVDFATVVNPWRGELVMGAALLRRAFNLARESGDLTFMAYSCNNLVTHLLAMGVPLDETRREAESSIAFARQAQFHLVVDVITGQLRLIRALQGLTPDFASFNDEAFDEAAFEQHLESDPGLAVAACSYWIRKLQARVHADDHAGAITAATKAERLLWTSCSPEVTLPSRLAHGLELAAYHFWAALAHAAAAADATVPAGSPPGLERLRAHHQQLAAWAGNNPRTFGARATLVAAELARLEARELDAERLYEQAIRSARDQAFAHDEALANELAARFHRARGLDTIADAYLRNARACYRRWGAFGKLKQLDEQHPPPSEEQAPRLDGGIIGAPLAQLDIGTVLKASQAMSGETVIDRLIEILMTIALEHAGASRGTLVLLAQDTLRIEAEAEAGPRSVAVRLVQRSVAPEDVPDSLLRTAMRTRQNVIIDDAQRANPFAQDRYFQRRQPRSALCLPLVTQAHVLGLLYLENEFAPGTFTAERTALLEVLAAQAALSLEMARLYRDLGQRETKIGRLVDANIVGIFIWEFGGGIREANDAFLRMIGYDREDLRTGRLHWSSLTPPEWLDRSVQAITEMKMTGIMRPYEKEYIRKDGSRVPVLLGSASFEDGSNQGVSFVLDLTERRRAEILTAQVFESAPDGICIVGRDYRYRRANPVYQRRWGAPPEGIVGMHVADLLGAEVFERILKPHLDRCFAGEEVSFEWVAEAHGRMFIAVTYSPLRSGSQEVEAALAIQRDISAYMRASESLREAQAELAHVNRVSTMGELSASIAHEVSQPITGVLSNARTALRWLALGTSGEEAARQAIERVIRDGGRAADVIGRIRDLVKKGPSRRDSFDLNGAIRDVIEISRAEAAKNRVAVSSRLEHGLPFVEGDRVQLQQVILNLAVNAVEAMSGLGEGPRELLVTSANDEGNAILVTVQDTGPGLDREHPDRVFEAFYTTKSAGLGMGLAICRSIIEAHHGRLWASANVPRGAIFQFTLPAGDGTPPG